MYTNFQPLIGISQQANYRSNQKNLQTIQEEFEAIRHDILIRDQFFCQGCGLHFPPSAENLVSLCPFCHGVQHIGIFSKRFGQAMTIIYCPELQQNELNLLSWVMAAALSLTKKPNNSWEFAIKQRCLHIRNALLARRSFPTSFFAKSDDVMLFTPKVFSGILSCLRNRDPKAYATRAQWLKNVKIFYDPQNYDSFTDRKKANIVQRLTKDSAWQPGDTWAETWAFMAQNILKKLPQPG